MTKEYKVPAEKPEFPQVEPEASFWFRCPLLKNISFEDVRKRIDETVTEYETDEANLRKDIAKLKNFYERRTDDFDENETENLSLFLKNKFYTKNPPPGSVISTNADDSPRVPMIKNGLELATLFENETPGLWHRHVLTVLFDSTVEDSIGKKISPPLQSLVWATLEMATSGALMTAWHYKWLATGKNTVARRLRPVEFDKTLKVLYDFEVERDKSGQLVRNNKKPRPKIFPGTPRHPAYPAGHSTYAAAASEILECFFGHIRDKNGNPLEGEFEKLAKNIGEARLWGGVHWSDDDSIGQAIGKAVAQIHIEQLNKSKIYNLLCGDFEIPERAAQEKDAEKFSKNCKKGTADFCEGLPRNPKLLQNLQG